MSRKRKIIIKKQNNNRSFRPSRKALIKKENNNRSFRRSRKTLIKKENNNRSFRRSRKALIILQYRVSYSCAYLLNISKGNNFFHVFSGKYPVEVIAWCETMNKAKRFVSVNPGFIPRQAESVEWCSFEQHNVHFLYH